MERIPQFYPISLKLLLEKEKPCPFDLYVQRSEDKFTKIYNKDDILDVERFQNYYDNKKVFSVYIIQEAYEQYKTIVDQAFIHLKIMTENSKPQEIMPHLEKIVDCLVLDIVGQGNIEDKVVYKAGSFVKTCVSILAQDSNQLAKLIRSFNNYDYCFKHSLIVSIMSIVVAKAAKVKNTKVLEIIALGGFLHDIALITDEFEKENTLKPQKMSDSIREHPTRSAEILMGFPDIPSEVIQIVAQHHEMPNGSGYPKGLYLNAIYYPARIVAIADRFSFLITPRENHNPMKGFEAIVEMMQVKGAYDSQILVEFARLLNFKV
jgi:putative nucleotidyltransferase with HDIG domain